MLICYNYVYYDVHNINRLPRSLGLSLCYIYNICVYYFQFIIVRNILNGGVCFYAIIYLI